MGSISNGSGIDLGLIWDASGINMDMKLIWIKLYRTQNGCQAAGGAKSLAKFNIP